MLGSSEQVNLHWGMMEKGIRKNHQKRIGNQRLGGHTADDP